MVVRHASEHGNHNKVFVLEIFLPVVGFSLETLPSVEIPEIPAHQKPG